MHDFDKHPYDECCERIKSENGTREAREWLMAVGKDYGVIHELSHAESIEAVEEAYSRGAELVEVIGEISDVPSENSVDMLLITLPEEREDRKMLFKLEKTIAGMSGDQLSVDEGQHFVLLRWT